MFILLKFHYTHFFLYLNQRVLRYAIMEQILKEDFEITSTHICKLSRYYLLVSTSYRQNLDIELRLLLMKD